MKGQPCPGPAAGEGRQAVNVAAFEANQSYVDLRPPSQQSAFPRNQNSGNRWWLTGKVTRTDRAQSEQNCSIRSPFASGARPTRHAPPTLR